MSAAQGQGVGVAIVNWNSGEYLLHCLECLRSQSRPAQGVLVIDNNSKDGSLDTAQGRFADVTFVRLPRNAGFAEANNLAVSMLAEREWILLVNPDAFLHGDCLNQLLRAAEANPGVSVFTPLLLQATEPPTVACAGDDYSRGGIAVHRGSGRPVAPEDASPAPVFSGSGAALLLRRQVFLDAGGFDTDYFCYYEDVDLGFRLQLLGQRCLFVPGAVARHVGGGTTGGMGNDYSLFYCHRNCIWTYVKNMPNPLFLRYLPLHLLALAKNIAAAALRGRSRLVMKATWEALRLLPKKFQERKRMQSRRRVNAAYIDSLLLRSGIPGISVRG